MSHDSQVALVTRAARGIGAALSSRLVDNGYAVAACVLLEPEWTRATQLVFERVDVTDEPREIADAVAFLAGDTSSFVTGADDIRRRRVGRALSYRPAHDT